MGRALPFHPMLFALYPVASLFANNVGLTLPSELWRSAAACLILVAIPWLLISLLLRSAARAAAFVSVLTLLFFDFQHMKPLVRDGMQALGLPWWRVEPHYLYVWAAVALALAAVPAAKRFNAAKVTSALNAFSIVLIGIAVWQATSALRFEGSGAGLARGSVQFKAPPDKERPDIFYIVLDSYGRHDALQKFLGIDNRPFLQELEKRGFYVATESRGNYSQTMLCLAGALNLNYVQTLIPNPEWDARIQVNKLIDQNLASKYMRALGYAVYYIPTHEPIQCRAADHRLEKQLYGLSPFEDALLETTPIEPPKAGSMSQPEQKRQRVLSAFDHLERLSKPGYKPRFVFAHLMMPHPPFVFGPDGSPRNPIKSRAEGGEWMRLPDASPEAYKLGYREQTEYTNKLVLRAIDALLDRKGTQPIVVIQGDHGSKLTYDVNQLVPDSVSEALPILSAFYVPESARAKLYPSISPVNTFRVVLSEVFGQDLPLLSDRSYYSPLGKLMQLTDVTDLVPRQLSAAAELRPEVAPDSHKLAVVP